MPMTVDVLRAHLNYTAWASSRLVDAASTLSPQELMRDFSTADHNVLGTLVHVYAADRVWLGRIERNPPARFIVPEQDMHLTVLQNDWPALLGRWKQWSAALTEDSIHKEIPYKDTKGQCVREPDLADCAARCESRNPSPWSGFRLSAGDGTHTTTSRPEGLLPR